MPTKTEPTFVHDFMAWEAEMGYCREPRIFRHAVGSTTSFSPGLVCEVSSGKMIPVATDANAAGILLDEVKDLATATDKPNVMFLVRGPAMVVGAKLNVNGGVLSAQLAALAALNVPILSKSLPVKTTTMGA